MIFDYYRCDLVSRGVKPHSLSTYDRVTHRFQAWLAEHGLAEDTAKFIHVQQFLQSSGWGIRTQHTALAYLRAAYNFALNMELIDRNPTRLVRLAKVPQGIPKTIPSRQLRQMRQDVQGPEDNLLLHLFAFTGCRCIEVRRLTWNYVSMADNTLHVFGKGDKERLVPIHPELRKCLVGRTWATGSAHVVPGRFGGMISHHGLQYRVQRVTGPGVQPHDFRRTVATSLRANSVDPYVRDAIMGWTRDEIFDRHYNHVSPRELQTGILRLYADDPV